MDIQKNYRIWIRCKKINIRSPLMYITRGSKFVTYNLAQVQQKKKQIQQRSDSNWQLSSDFPLEHMDSNVEHDPISGSWSNRILEYRTGSGLDWISESSTRSDMDIQTALITRVWCLNRVFFSVINRFGSYIPTSLPD